MIDTHAHVHDADFDGDRAATFERARAAGIDRIVLIGTDLDSSRRAQACATAYGAQWAVGIHPHETEDAPPGVAAAFDALVAEPGALRPVAVGEIGLDYYYDHSPRPKQREVLAEQLRYARERALPVLFHQRDAFDDFVALLRAEGPPKRAVIHCFSGDAAQAKTYVEEFGFVLGIGGVVTFKSAGVIRAAVASVGLDHLVLETDCPYLAPVPHRGKRNEPAFMTATVAKLAELFATSPDDVVAATTRNAEALLASA